MLQNVGDLQEKLEDRRKLLRKHSELVCVGDLTNVTSSYVIIDDKQYLMESPLKALDVCFKSFFALDIKYPIECQQVWAFIQTFVYNIQTPQDKTFSGVSTVIGEINVALGKNSDVLNVREIK